MRYRSSSEEKLCQLVILVVRPNYDVPKEKKGFWLPLDLEKKLLEPKEEKFIQNLSPLFGRISVAVGINLSLNKTPMIKYCLGIKKLMKNYWTYVFLTMFFLHVVAIMKFDPKKLAEMKKRNKDLAIANQLAIKRERKQRGSPSQSPPTFSRLYSKAASDKYDPYFYIKVGVQKSLTNYRGGLSASKIADCPSEVEPISCTTFDVHQIILTCWKVEAPQGGTALLRSYSTSTLIASWILLSEHMVWFYENKKTLKVGLQDEDCKKVVEDKAAKKAKVVEELKKQL
ncbi:hypothetical protein COCNU_10G007640 [Cocos nucifera]|uniref:Uncharacterized protein n=1 Tax=Cocos nucifera TaxID=13894 RepID=A0A8K0N7Y5_COCNU|nr:hypothetical protein COCNU_10G007640 [Cocos nucifera]